MTSKNASAQLKKLLRFALLGPALILSPWLFEVSTLKYFHPHALHVASIAVVSTVAIAYAALELGLVRTAVSFLLYGALWGASVGLGFLMCATEALFGYFPELAWSSLIFLGVGYVGTTVAVFLLQMRTAVPRVIAANSKAIDFDKMEYHALGPFVRADGKKQMTLSSLIAISFLGIPLGRLLPAGSFENVLAVAVFSFLAYAFIGYYAVANIYQAWLIRQRCSGMGRTMVISELAQ